MKHVDRPKSKSFWASIVMCLPHVIVTGIKKHGVGTKDSQGPFSLDA
jgi:hypothetical protein